MFSAIRMALQLVGFHWDQDSADPIESNGRVTPQQPDEELKGKIQELQQGAEKSQGVIRALQEQVGCLQKAQEQTATAEETICTLLGRVNTLEARITELQGVQELMATADETIRTLSGRVHALEAEIVQDRQAATVLNGQIQALEAQIAQLQKAQAQTEGKACALSGRVNALETEIAQDRQVATGLNGEIQALEAQIAQLQKVQAQMEGKACALLGRVETLETQNTQDRETVASGQSGIQQRSTTSYSKAEEIFYADGRVYTGGWIDGRPQGRGEMKFPNGNHYAGFWNNGVYEGQGTLKDGKGNVIYHGEWKHGVYEGQGTLKDSKGYVIYQGEWKHGVYDGQGTLKDSKGNVIYLGEWRQGGRHGKTQHREGAHRCSCTWNCGRLGQVSIRTKAGTCEIHQPPVEEYTENVIEKLKNAPLRGTITWTEGERYEGEFQFHQDFFRPHGKGCKTFNDLRQYDGYWHEGVISGQGVLTTFKEGHSFEGQFSVVRTKFGELTCLEREGHPTTLFFHENGWRYEGSVNEWKRPSGQGKMYIGKDLFYEGEWSSELFKKKNEWALRVDLEEPSYSGCWNIATILLFPKSNYRYEGVFPKNGWFHHDEQFPINDEAQANFGPHGAGIEYHGETRVYEGKFAEGLYHDADVATRYFPLRGINEFFGEFKKGVPDGWGHVNLETEEILTGTWENGDLDLSKVDWRFANGDNFYGSLEIVSGMFVAPKSGRFKFANGSVVEGTEWSNGFLAKPMQVQGVADLLGAYRSGGSCSSRPLTALSYLKRWDQSSCLN